MIAKKKLNVLFRAFLLQEKTQKTLSTFRYRTFAIGAYFDGDNIKIEKWNYSITLDVSDDDKPRYKIDKMLK